MINNPQVSYSGLTIVVDDKSRFDTTQLISGTAGSYFDNCLLTEPQYGVFRANCEIRTLAECKTLPFRPYTTALLLLGEESLKWAKPGVTLGEQRGSPFMMDSKVCVASYINAERPNSYQLVGDGVPTQEQRAVAQEMALQYAVTCELEGLNK